MSHTYTLRQQANAAWKATQHAMQGRDYPRAMDYPDLLRALAEEGEPDVTRIAYVAPVQPTEAEIALAALAMSDSLLPQIAARAIEDILDERIAAGKFVAQAAKDLIAERKANRAKL